MAHCTTVRRFSTHLARRGCGRTSSGANSSLLWMRCARLGFLMGLLLLASTATAARLDLGLVATNEPFQKLRNQGMILGENGDKMSKSRGNVVNPDDVIAAQGTDSLRLYLMFLGPLERDKPWNTQGIEGVRRFLERVWRLYCDNETNELLPSVQDVAPNEESLRILHKTIDAVTTMTEGSGTG